MLTEQIYASEFLLSEASGYRSRDQVTIPAGVSYAAGTVLGEQTVGALSAVATAKVGNTGNGVLTPGAVAPGTLLGKWKVKFLDATHYQVFAPAVAGQADLDGEGVTGTNYAGGIAFALPAGGTPFAEEDEIDVAVSAAAGSGNSVAWSPTATDGSQVVSGVLYAPVDTTVTNAATKAAAVTREAEVKTALLQYPAGDQAAAIAGLAAIGIIARS